MYQYMYIVVHQNKIVAEIYEVMVLFSVKIVDITELFYFEWSQIAANSSVVRS